MSLRITTPPPNPPIQALDPTALAVTLGAVGQEAAVGALITQMTATVEEIVGLHLWYRGYQAKVEGDDDDRLYLSARPIVAVSSVRQGTEDVLVEGTEDDEYEVWHEQGYLERPNCWASKRPWWIVEFTAGWFTPSMGADPGVTGAAMLADARPDVERAIKEIVILQWQIDSGDRRIKSAKLSSMAVEYRTDLWIPKTALAVLAGLRRPVV